MHDQTEEQLNRLTIVGWLLLVAHAAAFTVIVPLLLFTFCPAVLEIGRVTGYAIVVTIMICGWPCFKLCKCLLERCGITVLRPPSSCSSRFPDR